MRGAGAAAAGRLAVVPGDFDWDDVGDFASIAKLHSGGRKSDLAILGENARVLEWIAGRVAGTAPGVDTAIGVMPAVDALNLDGLDIEPAVLDELFEIDAKAWLTELVDVEAFFGQFGRALPTGLVR